MVHKKLENFLDDLIRVFFYALIFFLPISIALVSTCSGAAIFFFLVKRIMTRNFRPPQAVLNWPLAFYVAAVALSVVFSQYHHLSILGFVGKILRGVFLYVSFLEVFTTEAGIQNLIFVWCTSAFVTALSGLSQYFLGYDFIRHTPLVSGRAASSLRHANDFGAYIISACPVFLALVLHWSLLSRQMAARDRRIPPVVLCLFFVLTSVLLTWCLGLTYSRASWVAFFIAALLIGVYKRSALPVIVLLIAGFILVFSPMMLKARDATLLADNVVRSKPVPTVVLAPEHSKRTELKVSAWLINTLGDLGSGRQIFWKEAWHIIKEYPLWGAGLNTYSQMGERYKIDWGGYPHNSYLQMTAEVGVLGLGTFLFLLVVWFKSCVIELRRRSGYLRCVLIGLLGGVSAYLIQSFFDTTFYSVQLSVLLWLMLSMGIAIQRIDK